MHDRRKRVQAKEATERDAPKEVRILKWIVSIEGERDREAELDKAFKPVRCLLTHNITIQQYVQHALHTCTRFCTV
jgi:hypothetical protein